MAPAAMGKQEALAQFSVDLTERARKGEIDPVAGRDEEIRQIVDILMRRRQNNPILTGEAGVGKTAVVEGFALRIAAGDVPPPLKDVSLRALDVGLLQAGASMKGEFENRLRQVIDEVQSSPKPIILFIDEAHTLIGAGGAAGTGDAANLLKPALARGKLRTIAATTWAEYKKHIEKDPALTRRFQVVQVAEPDGGRRRSRMMRGMAATLEKHHRVAAPRRGDRGGGEALAPLHPGAPAPGQGGQPARHGLRARGHQPARGPRRGRGLPRPDRGARDRARDHRPRAGGRAGTTADARGGARQGEAGAPRRERAGASCESALEGRAGRWSTQDRSSMPPRAARREAGTARRSCTALQARARPKLQGEAPLIFPTVDDQAVAAVVGDWTGIPVGRMVKDEIETVLKLADTLGAAGHRPGPRAGDDRPAHPDLARRARRHPQADRRVLLAGPSGVGKTETALALAEALYGGEQNLITINMSEFQEAHTVSTLKGAPPGYVGYGEGGVLTEAVRRRPYSVVLLDEVEKAHPDVHEIFFQVFDKGMMEDGEGRLIDFKNTLILLTSNVGSDLIANLCKDPELMPEPEGIAEALREPLLKAFPAALLGPHGDHPLLPAQRRDDRQHRPAAARARRQAGQRSRTASRSPTTTRWSS